MILERGHMTLKKGFTTPEKGHRTRIGLTKEVIDHFLAKNDPPKIPARNVYLTNVLLSQVRKITKTSARRFVGYSANPH